LHRSPKGRIIVEILLKESHNDDVKRWLQLQFDNVRLPFDSTSIPPPIDCLSKVIEVIVT